jgi:parvulin-like peptidyl-prolyl isomerase
VKSRALENHRLSFLPFVILFFSVPIRAEKTLDAVKVAVGEIPILQSEIDSTFNELKKSPGMVSAFRLPQNFTVEQVIERKIEDAIMKIKVREMGIEIGAVEVENQISNIAKQYGISKSQLEASLKNEGISPVAYRTNIKAQLERRDVFDRTLRKGGGVSELELRRIYEREAETVYHLFTLTLPFSPQADQTLTAKRDEFKNASMPIEEFIKKVEASEEGWIAEGDLDGQIRKAISSNPSTQIIGPLRSGKVSRLLIIAGKRKGSEADFESQKSTLMAKAQAEDFEAKLNFWLETQKKEIQIIRN